MLLNKKKNPILQKIKSLKNKIEKEHSWNCSQVLNILEIVLIQEPEYLQDIVLIRSTTEVLHN